MGDAKGTTQISSGGLPRTLTLGKIVDRPSFSFHSLTALQESKQLTDNETLEVAKYLSYEAGKSSFEKNLKRKLTERNNSVDNFFDGLYFLKEHGCINGQPFQCFGLFGGIMGMDQMVC